MDKRAVLNKLSNMFWGDRRSSMLQSPDGVLILISSMLILLFSFFGLADRGHLLFASKSTTPGLIVEPPGRFWPFQITTFAALQIFALALLPSIFEGILYRKCKSEIWPLYLGSISFIGILVFFGATSGGIVVEGRNWTSGPMILVIGLVVLVLSFILISWVLMSPLIPDHEIEDLYITNQWRYAQATLTIGLAGVIGASVPFALENGDGVGPIAMILIIGTLLTPFLTVALFLIFRLHFIEKAKRGNGDISN